MACRQPAWAIRGFQPGRRKRQARTPSLRLSGIGRAPELRPVEPVVTGCDIFQAAARGPAAFRHRRDRHADPKPEFRMRHSRRVPRCGNRGLSRIPHCFHLLGAAAVREQALIFIPDHRIALAHALFKLGAIQHGNATARTHNQSVFLQLPYSLGHAFPAYTQ